MNCHGCDNLVDEGAVIDITRIDMIIVSNAPPYVYSATTIIILYGCARAHEMDLFPSKLRVFAPESPSYEPNWSSSEMNTFVCKLQHEGVVNNLDLVMLNG